MEKGLTVDPDTLEELLSILAIRLRLLLLNEFLLLSNVVLSCSVVEHFLDLITVALPVSPLVFPLVCRRGLVAIFVFLERSRYSDVGALVSDLLVLAHLFFCFLLQRCLRSPKEDGLDDKGLIIGTLTPCALFVAFKVAQGGRIGRYPFL